MKQKQGCLSIFLKAIAFIGLSCLLLACTTNKKNQEATNQENLTPTPSPVQVQNSEKTDAPESVPTVNPVMIFDLDGVLFAISKKRAVSKLGFFDVLSYTVSGKKVEALESVIFDILNQLEPQKPIAPGALVPMHGGRPLPKIMCDWLQGLVSSDQVLDRVLPYIEKLYKESYFSGKTEKKLVIKIIKIMFDPNVRAKLYKPLKKGICLLKSCKEQGYPIYLLTNMDSELVDLLKQEYPDIFALFDGIVVSATIKMIKPHENIYRSFLKKFNLTAADCYFIDDQKENIKGARNVGMHAMLHNKKKVKKTYRKLIKANLLPTKSIETCRVHS